MNIFFKIKQKRSENGMTMKQLGEKIGVTYRAIYQYESGRRRPDVLTLYKIAVVLGCKMDDLIEII